MPGVSAPRFSSVVFPVPVAVSSSNLPLMSVMRTTVRGGKPLTVTCSRVGLGYSSIFRSPAISCTPVGEPTLISSIGPDGTSVAVRVPLSTYLIKSEPL